MKFKEMKATFRVTAENDVYDYEFTIKRQVSGAFKYGNRSSHYLVIRKYANKEFLRDDLYDTRYDSDIPTIKRKWINYWTNYFKKNWSLNPRVKFLNYEEKEVEVDE